jgi:DNA polymerase III alpha subunit (gram-positive type)
LLSIGATIVTVHKADPPRIGASFYAELQPLPDAGVDADALAHAGGLTIEGLAETGLPPAEALASLSAWMEAEGARRPIFVAHCANFDWMFVAWYYARFGVPNPFGYAALDTKALAMGRLRASWRETGTENLARKLGIPRQDPATVHHAGHDAAWQARLLCALLTA